RPRARRREVLAGRKADGMRLRLPRRVEPAEPRLDLVEGHPFPGAERDLLEGLVRDHPEPGRLRDLGGRLARAPERARVDPGRALPGAGVGCLHRLIAAVGGLRDVTIT